MGSFGASIMVFTTTFLAQLYDNGVVVAATFFFCRFFCILLHLLRRAIAVNSDISRLHTK